MPFRSVMTMAVQFGSGSLLAEDCANIQENKHSAIRAFTNVYIGTQS